MVRGPLQVAQEILCTSTQTSCTKRSLKTIFVFSLFSPVVPTDLVHLRHLRMIYAAGSEERRIAYDGEGGWVIAKAIGGGDGGERVVVARSSRRDAVRETQRTLLRWLGVAEKDKK